MTSFYLFLTLGGHQCAIVTRGFLRRSHHLGHLLPCDELIVSHVGNEKGFGDNIALIFEAKKELELECHKNWLKNTLPKLRPNLALVIDNAPYHTKKVESLPTSS